MDEFSIIQLKRGLAADWTYHNPTLAEGEPGLELDTNKIKYGNGTTPWNSLPYFTVAGGGATTPLSVELADSAAVNINVSQSEYFYITTTGTAEFTFISPTPGVANRILAFTLEIFNSAGGNITWATQIRWAAATPPNLAVAGRHILEFVSRDDGGTWYGFLAGMGMEAGV